MVKKDNENEVDTVETPYRYLGLLGRLRTVIQAQSRLVAYTSEIGEAFRPIASPLFVTSAYAISWMYVLGDVSYEGYKMKNHGGSDFDVGRTVVERGIFQSLASMVFPAYSVHFVVHQSAKLFKGIKPGIVKRFGPSAIGLIDHPLEFVMEKTFDSAWPLTEAGVKARSELHSK